MALRISPSPSGPEDARLIYRCVQTRKKNMFKKHKRILWLLNHRTLMPYEAPLIQSLGFEIFIPKIFPAKGYRSGAADPAYDDSLSVPAKVLSALNRFNFYEDAWTPDIVEMVNRYFGCAFVIPHGQLCHEAVDNFEGQIVLRAFGLDNGGTYKQFLENLHGPLILRKIESIRHRFWFGEGYDHLHEIEPAVFQERSLFLPIGIPDSQFSTARQWTGTEKKILFVCPNAISDAYYSGIYRAFKEAFGDLPHVIVGAQDVPVPDPHVVGFVSDTELRRLYLECGVLYYHSTETRHVHYSPIEAAINGMPVVYRAGSLLDRLSNSEGKGRVDSEADARALVSRILSGDAVLIQELQQDQQGIAYHFSDAYCAPVWHQEMAGRGFLDAMRGESATRVLWTELARRLRKSKAHGRLVVDPHRDAVALVGAQLDAEQARERFGSSLFDGIRFDQPEFPGFVYFVDGIAAFEGWGRWSNSHKIVIVLRHKLEGRFKLLLLASAYGKNAGAPVAVRIGDQNRTITLGQEPDEASPACMHFDLETPSNIIEIDVPYPTRPVMDSRLVGLGLVEIRAAPPVVMDAATARSELGLTLENGIEFSAPTFPVFLDSMKGIGEQEPWGRWSIGDKVTIDLKYLLQGEFRLLFRATAYGSNVGVPVLVKVGSQSRLIQFPSELAAGQEVAVAFDLDKASNSIEITVPHPTYPPNDGRMIGIGFQGLRSEGVYLSPSTL